MIPYILLTLFVFLLQIVPEKKNRIAFGTGLLILFLFTAFRGNGNGDYFTYLERGLKLKSWSDVLNVHVTEIEPGYNFLYYLFVQTLGLSAQWVIAAMNFISLFCTGWFIKKYSPNKVLSLALFLPLYFQFDMHAARTAVAIGITLLAIPFVLDRKPVLFLCIIIAATCFHRVAWIGLLLYLLPCVSIPFISGLAMCIGLIVIKIFISVDAVCIGIFKLVHLDSYAARYSAYVSGKFAYPFKLYDPRLLQLIGIYIAANIIIRNHTKLEHLMINCCLCNIFLYIVFSDHTFIAYRCGAFYNIYTIILIPQILQHLPEWVEKQNNRWMTRIPYQQIARYMVNMVYIIYTFGIFWNEVEYRFFWMNL